MSTHPSENDIRPKSYYDANQKKSLRRFARLFTQALDDVWKAWKPIDDARLKFAGEPMQRADVLETEVCNWLIEAGHASTVEEALKLRLSEVAALLGGLSTVSETTDTPSNPGAAVAPPADPAKPGCVKDGTGAGTAGGRKQTSRKAKSADATKLELLKRLLLAIHCPDEPTDQSRQSLSTRDISELLEKKVSPSTVGRSLKKLFRDNIAVYRDACRNGTVAVFVQGLAEAQKTIGTTDPDVLAELVTEDGVMQKPRLRQRTDD